MTVMTYRPKGRSHDYRKLRCWYGCLGPSSYDVHKKSGFPPLPCPYASTWAGPPPLLWTSTCSRHEIHIVLLKRTASSLHLQWPSGPKAEIWLQDCNLFNIVLLVIYITNLYLWKISTFYSVQRRNSGKKYANFFAGEEDRMTSVDSNFNFLCGRKHGAWSPSSCPHASTWAWPPSPLRVNVINGWPPV